MSSPYLHISQPKCKILSRHLSSSNCIIKPRRSGAKVPPVLKFTLFLEVEVCIRGMESVITCLMWRQENYNLGPGSSSDSVRRAQSESNFWALKTNLAVPSSRSGLTMYYGLEEGTSVGLVFILVSLSSQLFTMTLVKTVLTATPGPGPRLRHRDPGHHGSAVQEARHHRGGHKQVPGGQLPGKHQGRDCQVISVNI